ncbi:MAG: hypothetical protein IT242_10590 [Bacteroidia bacterium]|nr:hypothetical protein [Bacteroidia bacterium]
MNYEKISEKIGLEIEMLFEELRSGISAREVSRAFGAIIEKRITESWENVCSNMDYQAIDIQGRRTIFDVACNSKLI